MSLIRLLGSMAAILCSGGAHLALAPAWPTKPVCMILAKIVTRLNAEVNKALQDPAVRARLAARGADAPGGTGAEYAAYICAEMPRWATAIKDSGAKAE